MPSRRTFLQWSLLAGGCLWNPLRALADEPSPRGGGHNRRRPLAPDAAATELAPPAVMSVVLGRPTSNAITISALPTFGGECFVEYGPVDGVLVNKTAVHHAIPGEPLEIQLDGLPPGKPHAYRVRYRKSGEDTFTQLPADRFVTQRPPGDTFTFCIQGDSHPERPQMWDADLYARTLAHAASHQPDLYFCMGDDFSVAPLREVTKESVAARYLLQRPFLGLIGAVSPIFLLNGNHEQASLFNYSQSDERHNLAVFAQNARNKYFPVPAPDAFYSGDSSPRKEIGLLRDYLSFTWGDALFVILDNYWQCPALVDSGFRERDSQGKRDRNWWDLTLGEAQYRWLKKTLEESKARFKFVFAHHVLGSGRGGVDEADFFEWGGHNKRGDYEFAQQRPGWELPIHQLMAKHNVTIFFQGHDHLYAHQQKDGIIYQECPMPADAGYVAYNSERYRSGIKLPNSGFLRVTVSPEQVKVDYVRCYLPKDENATRATGEIAHSYEVKGSSRGV